MRIDYRERNSSKVRRAIRSHKAVVLSDDNEPIALIEPLVPASTQETAVIQKWIDSGLLQPVSITSSVREWRWRRIRSKAA